MNWSSSFCEFSFSYVTTAVLQYTLYTLNIGVDNKKTAMFFSGIKCHTTELRKRFITGKRHQFGQKH